MSDERTRSVLLSFSASYAAVADQLSALGLEQVATMSWTESRDPEEAEWRGGSGRVRFETDFDTGQKRLVAFGEFPEGWTGSIPLMTREEARRLMASGEKPLIVAGLVAAGHFADESMRDAVRDHLIDPDPDIGGEAAMAISEISSQTRSTDDVSEGSPRAPFANLFATDGWRKEKLQVVRWFGRDGEPISTLVKDILGDLIASADWEIRATAMLAAGRMRLTDLRRDIAGTRFAQDAAIGLARHEQRLLLALQAAALERVGGAAAHGLPPGLGDTFAGDFDRLAPNDAAFAWSLIEPLPELAAEPPPGAGIVRSAQGPVCEDGVLLSWVPPRDYWLGHGDGTGGAPNPARRVRIGEGFYIESEPRDAAGWAEAGAVAAERARTLGRPVGVATGDEWEAAARGPDGRRWPWGQNPDPALRVDLSPLGVAGLLDGPGEWLAPDRPGGAPLVTPGAGGAPLSLRLAPPPGAARLFRLVYRRNDAGQRDPTQQSE